MAKKIFIILNYLLLLSNSNSFSQANVEWFRTYGAGWGKNFVNDFAMDSLGNTYLTGNVSLNSFNSRTAIGTVKYNASGDLQWAKNYEGSSPRYSDGIALAVDRNGNVYVTGICTDIDSSENYCTIKYSSTGNLLWVKKFHSSQGARDEAADIALDKENNVYVTGYTYGFTQYIWSTLKYDSSGNLLWMTRYEGDLKKYKRSRKISLDNENNVYITGFTTGDSSSQDFCTIKYNKAGQQQWISIFNNSNYRDEPTDLSLDNSGNVYIVGQSYATGGFYTSLVKYDNSGNEIWNTKTDSTGENDSWYYNKISFNLDPENNIYIATTYKKYCCTIKYDSKGKQKWISKYNRDTEFEYSKGIGINIDNFGNVYTAGYSRIFGNVQPFITLKYSPDGIILWDKSFNVYNDVEIDEGAFVSVDKNNNVYVAGNHDDPFHSNKALYGLLKYSQGVGINNISSEIPGNFNLYQNYPNPFNPKSIIRFDVTFPTEGVVLLKVYDILGNEVRTLVNEKKSAGTYEVEFDGNDLASGVYYYKLSAGDFSRTKRLVLLK